MLIKIWNELPLDTDFSSINSFARALVGLNFSDYCDNYYTSSHYILFLCNFMTLLKRLICPAIANEPTTDIMFLSF